MGYGSRAIDNGSSLNAPADDIKGAPRPFDIIGHGADGTGEEYDVGAYEALMLPAPQAPSQLDVDEMSLNHLVWSWRDNSFIENGYEIYAGPGPIAPDVVTQVTAADVTSWRQGGLTANTQYAIQVLATGMQGTVRNPPTMPAIL